MKQPIIFQSKDGQITGSITYEPEEALPYVLAFNQRPDGKPLGFSAVSRYANIRVAKFFMNNRAGHDCKILKQDSA